MADEDTGVTSTEERGEGFESEWPEADKDQASQQEQQPPDSASYGGPVSGGGGENDTIMQQDTDSQGLQTFDMFDSSGFQGIGVKKVVMEIAGDEMEQGDIVQEPQEKMVVKMLKNEVDDNIDFPEMETDAGTQDTPTVVEANIDYPDVETDDLSDKESVEADVVSKRPAGLFDETSAFDDSSGFKGKKHTPDEAPTSQQDTETSTFIASDDSNVRYPHQEGYSSQRYWASEEPSASAAHGAQASVQQPDQEGTTLRHRINPEPPRDSSEAENMLASNAGTDGTPKGMQEKRKIALIRQALASNPVDVDALRNLALSPGGLVNKNMRQKVWPLLIGVNTNNITPKPSQEEMQSLTQIYSQVVMDVNRSSSRFPPGIDDHVRMSMKDKLVDLIMRVMLKHRQLKYYQGFHDVCITFLLCMDEDLAFAMVDKLAMTFMREYLDDTMERTSLLLNYIYPIINKCNPELCQHMMNCDLGTIFALSWVITWFSHVLGDIRRILRVFDFFLASHRMMPVYLSAAFVLYREQAIYEAGDEMGYIHKCLSTIPPDLPLEHLLERGGDLFLQYPPVDISRDPMLLRLNKNIYEHFNRIDIRNAQRRLAPQPGDVRNRMFVKATMWTVTAVVGIAAAVLYHSYMGDDWTLVDVWSPFR